MNSHDDLESIRRGIDDVDRRILRLLAERRSFSVRAARLKGAQGSDTRDRLREEDLIAERIESGLDHEIDAGLVNRLWREIVDDSVRVQRDLLGRRPDEGAPATVAIQGVEGSYSQLATRQVFDSKGEPDPAYVMCATFAAERKCTPVTSTPPRIRRVSCNSEVRTVQPSAEPWSRSGTHGGPTKAA